MTACHYLATAAAVRRLTCGSLLRDLFAILRDEKEDMVCVAEGHREQWKQMVCVADIVKDIVGHASCSESQSCRGFQS